MSEAHRRRAVEWFLVLKQLELDDALSLALTPEPDNETEDVCDQPSTPAKGSGNDPDGQDADDTREPIHSFWPISRR